MVTGLLLRMQIVKLITQSNVQSLKVKQLGLIGEVQNDQRAYPEQYKNREIWAEVIASRDIDSDPMLMRSEGERITNGETTATIQRVLTSARRPAVYAGKTPPAQTTLRVTVPLEELQNCDFIKIENNGNLQALVGEAVYMPDFYTERPISLLMYLQTLTMHSLSLLLSSSVVCA